MIKKTFLTLSLTAVIICLSIPAFAMDAEEGSSLRGHSRTTKGGRASGFEYTGTVSYTKSEAFDIWLIPSPEQLEIHQKKMTELTQKRSSLDPFQAIESKNKVELSTLLSDLNEQYEIEYEIEMLLRKIPPYEPLFLLPTSNQNLLSHFEQRDITRDRLCLIVQKKKEITERLEGMTFCHSIPTFAMGVEDSAPSSSTTRYRPSEREDIRDKLHKCKNSYGMGTPMGWEFI